MNPVTAISIEIGTKELLKQYADLYETPDFLDGDPSLFMHQVSGCKNQEAMAFIAACLSYGRRPQFMKKIHAILEWTGGDVDAWVRNGLFENHFRTDDQSCFYRLFTHATMYRYLCTYQHILHEYGTLGQYVRRRASDGFSAVAAITQAFSDDGPCIVVPRNMQSACKRVCMFLRWMVRSNSPVDIGLWADFIDRRTLIMPLDTHVLQQSIHLGLLNSKTTTMASAQRLTAKLAEIFPDDPLKGDFALFGYGVNGG